MCHLTPAHHLRGAVRIGEPSATLDQFPPKSKGPAAPRLVHALVSPQVCDLAVEGRRPCLPESFEKLLCTAQRSLLTRKKHVPHPISVGWQFLAVLELVDEKRPQRVPVRMLSAVQIFLCGGNGLLKHGNPFNYGMSLCVHRFTVMVSAG